MRIPLEHLQITPRKLGVVNELRTLTTGGVAWSTILLCLCLWGFVRLSGVDRVVALVLLRAPATATGVVVDVREPDWSFSENEVEVAFEYQVEGRRLEGFCYRNTLNPDSVGREVTVAYSPTHPTVARIEGYRYARYQWAPLVLGGLALLLLTNTLACFWATMRVLTLLKKGRATPGKLVKHDVKMENTSGLYEFTFEYTDDQGAVHQVTQLCPEPKRLMDDDAEVVLHHPQHPKQAQVLDQLPFRMTMSKPGVWDSPGWGGITKNLVLLALAAFLLAKTIVLLVGLRLF